MSWPFPAINAKPEYVEQTTGFTASQLDNLERSPEFLLEYCSGDSDFCALISAIQTANVEDVTIALNRGLDVNSHGGWALKTAVWYPGPPTMTRGKNRAERKAAIKSHLHWEYYRRGRSTDNKKIINLLLSHGAIPVGGMIGSAVDQKDDGFLEALITSGCAHIDEAVRRAGFLFLDPLNSTRHRKTGLEIGSIYADLFSYFIEKCGKKAVGMTCMKTPSSKWAITVEQQQLIALGASLLIESGFESASAGPGRIHDSLSVNEKGGRSAAI